MSQKQNPRPNPPPYTGEGVRLDSAVIDRESNGKENDHTSLKLWLRLLTCTTMIESCVKKGLRTDFETTLPRFDLMAQLERNPQGLTMGDLSQRMMVSGGNITGITDQLENEKLVERFKLPGDRRIYYVRLTAKGKETFAAMAAVHEEWIVDWMSDLTLDEQHLLYGMLGKLKRSLQEKGCEA